MSQHITVTAYDPLWAEKYEQESALVRDILADSEQRVAAICAKEEMKEPIACAEIPI